MIRFPNAKINIGLQVVAKRSDGYHDLETVFYPVSMSDVLEIIPSEQTAMHHSGLRIAGDSFSNLCLKAFELMHSLYNMQPVAMYLHKIIPMGAGLGGGSSDAAFTLSMLNEFFHVGLEESVLKELALKLGSDCPFFLMNKPAFATGKGELLTAVSFSLKGYHLAIVIPAVHVSTKEAFSLMKPAVPKIRLDELILQPVEEWKNLIVNDFEKTLFPLYPVIGEIKKDLYLSGAVYASMTGSGSAVYGIFKSKPVLPPLPPGTIFWVGPCEW